MDRMPELSDREIEILRLLGQGKSNKELAQELFISVNTVKVHLNNVFKKLGVSSRTEATLFAIEHKIIDCQSQKQKLSTFLYPKLKNKRLNQVVLVHF